jgi:nicotinamidase-related amidase
VVPDPYAGVAPTWDSDAARVYGPIAADLVAATPHPLAGRIVLDAGAGTGLVSRELQRADARVVALDLSVDMLGSQQGHPAPIESQRCAPAAAHPGRPTLAAMLISAEGAAVLLIDVQERLVPALDNGKEMVANAARLAAAATLLDVPVCATEQAPDKLGPTVAEVAPYPQLVLSKTTFNAAGYPTLLPPGTEDVLVAGCEAHVCVLQTVLGLLAARHRVLVVTDAVGSRTAANREAALDRLARHGAELVTTEMVLFEWLRDATHPRFREVQALIR